VIREFTEVFILQILFGSIFLSLLVLRPKFCFRFEYFKFWLTKFILWAVLMVEFPAFKAVCFKQLMLIFSLLKRPL
jgi:hypothetical protein